MSRTNLSHRSAPPPRALDTELEIERRCEPSRLECLAFDLGVTAEELRRHLRCEVDRQRVHRLPVRDRGALAHEERLAA